MKSGPYVDIRGYHKGVTGSTIRNTVHFADGTIYRYLVDYGMYQGEGHSRGLDYNDSVNPEKIDTVLLTHPHLDHDGALPIFVKKGYDKKIYMTDAVYCVIDIGFNDSYNIMKRDSKILKTPPLYSQNDIDSTLQLTNPVRYEEPIDILKDRITVTFFNNGHLMGSSIILVQIKEFGYDNINILYTGDYKPTNCFLDIKPLPYWVYALPNLTIVSEATYGTTNTWDISHKWEEDIIEACSKKRVILNTAFAQGRFQELMLKIRNLKENGLIPKDYPIKVDGKTGIDYTFRYISHSIIIHFKPESLNFFPENLQFVDDKTRPGILSSSEGKIIISTAGMGSNGPAKEYIKRLLPNPNALIYFPGYTSEGTIGRRVFEAEKDSTVLINGQEIIKRATVLQTLEFSSHAMADELLEFYCMFAPKAILFNHGTLECKEALEKKTNELLFKPKKYEDSNIEENSSKKRTGILGNGYVYRINQYGIDKEIKK